MNCKQTTFSGRAIHQGCWIIAFLCFCQSVAQGSAADDDAVGSVDASSPHLALVWNDPYRGLPHTYKTMKREVERIFNDVGIDVRMEKRGLEIRHEAEYAKLMEVNIVLLPVEPTAWGKGAGVLGVTMWRPGEKPGVYLFFPSIVRSLGLELRRRTLERPPATKELARAIGRIVAHELVHFIAPSHPHTEEGLMCILLDRRFLVQSRIRLDPASARAVVDGLQERLREQKQKTAARKPDTSDARLTQSELGR